MIASDIGFILIDLLQIGIGAAIMWFLSRRLRSGKPTTMIFKIGLVFGLVWGGCMIAASFAHIISLVAKLIRGSG
jgi:hypothetical protein